MLAFGIALHQLHALSLCSREDVEACLAAVSAESALPFAWADALDKQVSFERILSVCPGHLSPSRIPNCCKVCSQHTKSDTGKRALSPSR